ncbi:MAG: hypothetical protein KAX38_00610 [Candidatus Krumholzibacteria bacterium]|nr:hypothetical protein [Candidatus Krumholzibacteria bacterium]
MRKFLIFIMIVILAGLGGRTASYAIDEISVSGPPGALAVSSATAGYDPDAVTDATSTYSYTSDGAGRKIQGHIDTVMPANTALNVTLAAPTGASSQGKVTLGTGDQDLVTGIGLGSTSGLTITYELSATTSAGVVGATSRTVTLTIVAA